MHKIEEKEYHKIYYFNHKEYFREKVKEWRKNNPERNKEIAKKAIFKYYINNPKKRIEKQNREKEYNLRTHYAAQKKFGKKYRELNKEKYNKYQRDYRRKWAKTKKGKKYIQKNNSEYQRRKKWIEIFPNIFPPEIPVDYHHIDGKWFVAPLPRKIHRRYPGFKAEHITENMKWIEFFYGTNPEDLLWDGLHA